MSMLSKENKNIDAIIINVHSPNLDSFKLLAQAVALDIVSLFVCDEENGLLIKKALEGGAYFFLKNPLAKKIVKCVRQLVLRGKIQRKKARNGAEEED
ncbi:two-component response regulator ARR2-like [Solanum stenotomum]|uniref:two-component response regulator ARR2-like n=1 Tax=Solanum stenotomum TaxID=172797 RepID=UPI0020D08FEE|nr:two-component response regulator ARR2-like [Solanum stenotomum]